MRSQWTSFSATWECPGPSLCHLYRLAELPTTRKSPLAQNARSQDVRNQSWRHVLCAGTITPKICIWRSPKTGPARGFTRLHRTEQRGGKPFNLKFLSTLLLRSYQGPRWAEALHSTLGRERSALRAW